VAELPDVQARLEVRLNEVVEIQRDAESRAKRQADEFRDVLEKDWKAFAVAQEEKWFERDRRISDYEPRLTVIEEELPTYMRRSRLYTKSWRHSRAPTRCRARVAGAGQPTADRQDEHAQ